MIGRGDTLPPGFVVVAGFIIDRQAPQSPGGLFMLINMPVNSKCEPYKRCIYTCRVISHLLRQRPACRFQMRFRHTKKIPLQARFGHQPKPGVVLGMG